MSDDAFRGSGSPPLVVLIIKGVAAVALVFALFAALHSQQEDFVPLPTGPMPPALIP